MHQPLRLAARVGRRRAVTAALVALAALAIVSGPTLAAYPPWYASSANCYYEKDATGERVLNFIAVSPPELYADAGTQQVGWRFVVRRSKNWDVGPWKVTYRSPLQKAQATENQPGSPFAMQGVDVHVPKVDDKSAIRYHITLKMQWYAFDGSVAHHSSHRFNTITWAFNRKDKGQADYCPASLDTGP